MTPDEIATVEGMIRSTQAAVRRAAGPPDWAKATHKSVRQRRGGSGTAGDGPGAGRTGEGTGGGGVSETTQGTGETGVESGATDATDEKRPATVGRPPRRRRRRPARRCRGRSTSPSRCRRPATHGCASRSIGRAPPSRSVRARARPRSTSGSTRRSRRCSSHATRTPSSGCATAPSRRGSAPRRRGRSASADPARPPASRPPVPREWRRPASAARRVASPTRPSYPSTVTMAGYTPPPKEPVDPAAPPAPEKAIASDVNAPTTTIGSSNSFTMTLDYAARSMGLQDEVWNRLQNIHFYWELLDVTGLTPKAAEERDQKTDLGEGEHQHLSGDAGGHPTDDGQHRRGPGERHQDDAGRELVVGGAGRVPRCHRPVQHGARDRLADLELRVDPHPAAQRAVDRVRPRR